VSKIKNAFHDEIIWNALDLWEREEAMALEAARPHIDPQMIERAKYRRVLVSPPVNSEVSRVESITSLVFVAFAVLALLYFGAQSLRAVF
jgi:hypothetical protein